MTGAECFDLEDIRTRDDVVSDTLDHMAVLLGTDSHREDAVVVLGDPYHSRYLMAVRRFFKALVRSWVQCQRRYVEQSALPTFAAIPHLTRIRWYTHSYSRAYCWDLSRLVHANRAAQDPILSVVCHCPVVVAPFLNRADFPSEYEQERPPVAVGHWFDRYMKDLSGGIVVGRVAL